MKMCCFHDNFVTFMVIRNLWTKWQNSSTQISGNQRLTIDQKKVKTK